MLRGARPCTVRYCSSMRCVLDNLTACCKIIALVPTKSLLHMLLSSSTTTTALGLASQGGRSAAVMRLRCFALQVQQEAICCRAVFLLPYGLAPAMPAVLARHDVGKDDVGLHVGVAVIQQQLRLPLLCGSAVQLRNALTCTFVELPFVDSSGLIYSCTYGKKGILYCFAPV